MHCQPTFLTGSRVRVCTIALPSLVAALSLLLAQLALASPAPWYWWQSKVDGVRICAQVSPGVGWERDGGPYAGPGCAPKPKVYVIPMR